MITETEALNLGRLFAMKLRHNAHARQNALDSIEKRRDGYWYVRVGGRMRGTWHQAITRDLAVKRATDYYNQQLMDWVLKHQLKGAGHVQGDLESVELGDGHAAGTRKTGRRRTS